jgi:hypothetical protein
MSDSEQIISQAIAKLSLLEQLVRLLLRERASRQDQTPDDIRRWAEETKAFFEARMPPGRAESYITAAVDTFFTVLASDVARNRESPREPPG